MNLLLHHVDLITRCRRRGDVEAAATLAIHQMLGALRTELYKVFAPVGDVLVGLSGEISGDGDVVSHDDGLSWPSQTVSIDNFPHLQACFGSDVPMRERLADGSARLIMMMRKENHEPYGFLVIRRSQAFESTDYEVAAGLVKVLRNSLSLLEYSETDTLTRLLNRKTFDEYLMKILANIPLTEDESAMLTHLPQRRQARPAVKDHWLGVMDIDKFKSINDKFGHLIGDEVLILMANLMRDSFRHQDMLFRFGGEEFVALLRPAEFSHAQNIFERFRARVEGFAFQVGHVTISIGYTRIKLGDTPSFILDSADESLYWAKEHGRNQCQTYETLIAEGKLQRPVAQTSDVELF